MKRKLLAHFLKKVLLEDIKAARRKLSSPQCFHRMLTITIVDKFYTYDFFPHLYQHDFLFLTYPRLLSLSITTQEHSSQLTQILSFEGSCLLSAMPFNQSSSVGFNYPGSFLHHYSQDESKSQTLSSFLFILQAQESRESNTIDGDESKKILGFVNQSTNSRKCLPTRRVKSLLSACSQEKDPV